MATVKYWVVDVGALREADGEVICKYRDLGNLAYYLIVGNGVLRTRYDTATQLAHIDAVGRVESISPESGEVVVEWRSANFEISPGPHGRRHWEQKPYFVFNADRARAYELPARFAEAFKDSEWLNHKIAGSYHVRNIKDDEIPSLYVQEGFVYLMQWGNEYKIGKAVDVERRQKRLARDLDRNIKVLHRIFSKDYTKTESQLHRKYKEKHLHGEWFALDEEDVTWFKSIDNL